MKEIRNFKPLAQWIELLETVGFEISSERLLQEGDSSMNTMIKCTKKCITQSEQEFCAVLDVNKTHKDYHRDPVQKYLTIPEWNNVDAAQHYGQFIEHTPFYEFPYVGHISSFWKAFAQSWRCAAQEKGGHLKLLLSPSILFNYTLMNLFVGVSSTVEYSLKAIISWPIRAMLSGVEASTLLVLVNDPSNEIAALDPSIVVQKQYTEGIKLVEMPRYIKFRNVVKKMMNSSISFIEIAGNDHILCKVRSAEPLELKNSWQQKFTWTMPTQQEYTYAAVNVPVKELVEFIKSVQAQKGEVLYIHDF